MPDGLTYRGKLNVKPNYNNDPNDQNLFGIEDWAVDIEENVLFGMLGDIMDDNGCGRCWSDTGYCIPLCLKPKDPENSCFARFHNSGAFAHNFQNEQQTARPDQQ